MGDCMCICMMLMQRREKARSRKPNKKSVHKQRGSDAQKPGEQIKRIKKKKSKAGGKRTDKTNAHNFVFSL